MPASSFVWYELMTTDIEAAKAFYSSVVGWNAEDFSRPEMRYYIMKAGEANAAGLMVLPDEVQKHGGRPGWVGYIGVADIHAAAESMTQAGGHLHRAPQEIPGVGLFSPASDPQGAMFMLFQPIGGDAMPPQQAPGFVGWHELYSKDWEAAFAFYSSQFGWTKDETLDMGPMGKYQLFATGGAPVGGMMNNPDPSRTYWGYYFIVDSIEAAVGRLKDGGGTVTMGPHQVPGGTWVVQATDPQGANFALTSAVQ